MSPEIRKEVTVIRLRKGSAEKMEDVIAIETPATIYVNGNQLVTLLVTPDKLRELAVGHLLSEGLIRSADAVKSVKVDGGRIYVELSSKIDDILKSYSALKVRFSSCGQVDDGYLRLLDELAKPKVRSDVKFTPGHVFKAVRFLNFHSELFRSTGGVHVALIMDASYRILAMAEDIGRHNAVDKVVGSVALAGIRDFGGLFLACSGRLTSEIVMKAARIGIPLLASISAATDVGIKLAEKAGVTLVGFARGERMNVYTLPERLGLPG